MHAPVVPPNAWAQTGGVATSPAQKPGWSAVACKAARHDSPAVASYLDWADSVLMNSPRQAAPSPGRPAAVQHGLYTSQYRTMNATAGSCLSELHATAKAAEANATAQNNSLPRGMRAE